MIEVVHPATDIEPIIAAYMEDFHAGRLQCCETVLLVMCKYFGYEMPAVPRIASAFGGGMGAMQFTCGAFTGALMAIGLRMGRELGGDRAPAVAACRALYEHFQTERGTIVCREILRDVDFSVPEQQAVFRAPGGKHETVCEPLVADICRYLAKTYPNP